MRKSPPREPLFSHVRSWADGIPLGSLDQLQQAAGRSRLLRGDADDPASISLPASRESSLQDTGSKDSQQAQKSERFVPDAQGQRRLDAAEALNFPLPESSLDTVEAPDVPLPESGGRGHDVYSSGAVSAVDSLAQLQTAVTSVLEQSHQLDTADALDFPLPSSSGFGNDRCSSEGVSTVDSLTQLQTAGVSALEQSHQPDTVEPVNVPLPESSGLGSGRYNTRGIEPQSRAVRVHGPAERSDEQLAEQLNLRPSVPSYWENIRPLAQTLPHLKAIWPPNGRHQRVGRLKTIDYFNNGRPPRVGVSFEICAQFSQDQLVTELQHMKQGYDSVASRVVIVEDLCSELIGALGLAFDLDPEFFAEHLNRSGYSKFDYEDPPPTQWNTAHLPKDHASMTWMRPVYQSIKVAELSQTPGALLDPPKRTPDGKETPAKSAAAWKDAAYNAKGERDGRAMEHSPLVDTNVFRQSWLLGAQPIDQADLQGVGDESQPEQKKVELRPAAWQERASFCYHGRGTDMLIGIILVDPLPAITDSQTPLFSREELKRSWVRVRKTPTSGRARQTPTSNRVTRTALEIALPMSPRLPSGMPRNKYKANNGQVASLQRSFVNLASTFDCIQPDDFPMMSLLILIENDTLVLFRSLERSLDVISHDSLDDFLMTRRLPEWRKLMNHFEIEIPAIQKRLEHFSYFVFCPNNEQVYPHKVGTILQAVYQNIAAAKTKLVEAHADLRADMQFTESRRSITETQTVTRLTELAFVFIPLSFCASLFSMSIKELEDGVPVWMFVVAALVTIALAYAVRLFVGSELLINSTRRSLERFRARTGVRPEADVPMISLVWLVAQDVWKNGGPATSIPKYLGVTAAIVLPIAFMWTTESMGSSFNTAVTLLVFLGTASMFTTLSALIELSAPLAEDDREDHDYTGEV